MADINTLLEGERRNMLSADQQALLDEARKRGMVPPKGDNALTHGLAVAGTAMYKGVADIAGLPDTAGRAFTTGTDKIRELFGLPTSSETKQSIAAAPDRPVGMGRFGGMSQALKTNATQPESAPVQQRVEDWIFKMVPKVEPQTTAENYIAAGSRAAAGGAIAGPVGVASNAAGGVAGEAAGQITKGTPYEPYARFIANLVVGAGAAYGITKLTDAQQYIKNTLRNYTPDDFAKAQSLVDDATAAGTNLTPTEALAQVKGGNSPLMGVQRYAENAPASGPKMAQFMSQRGPGNQAMVGNALDDVSPNAGAIPPTEVAPGINAAATNAVNDVRKGINAEAKPFYDQAQSQSDQLVGYGVNPYAGPAWDAMSQSPSFKLGLTMVRADPKYAGLAQLPDYDIEVLNAVKKALGQGAIEASSPGIGKAADFETSTFLNKGKQGVKDAVGTTFPDYRTALDIGSEGRAAKLLPAERAPIGQLATEPNLTGQQNILLPKLASDASPEQVAKTVSTLIDQGATDQVQELLRLKLKDIFDTSLPNVKGAAEQFRGAQFANNVSRYDNQIKSLEAAVKELPNGEDVWTGLSKALEVLKAQGQRMPVGSPTEFNRLMTQQAEGSGGLLGLPIRAGQTVANFGRDAVQKMAGASYAKQLAGMLTNPRGVSLLESFANSGSRNAYRQIVNGLLSYERSDLPAK